ncbi:high affinity immunoglobulin gamma Fc receptor I-like [Colossoma macropomum]|uniref:high affinity immunoglobulin gamma Fc receptor I-like n=1 Tax=Colossoma macropomum TaxID=42526 RepID=UPI0018648999|nr:high affinity immunoglobulin gamma Fc receptor I-like [Colossoma macropomum]
MEFRSLSVILLLIVLIHSGQTQDKPAVIIKDPPGRKEINIGETVTLKCEIPGGEGRMWTYSWYNNGNEVHRSEERSEYTFQMTADYSTEFTCKGTTRSSDPVKLSLSERPKAVASIQPDEQVFIGETVTLRCDIQGEGVSNWQYSWFKDDSSTPVSYEEQYRISSVTESHRGKYTCRGTERGTSRYSHTSDAVALTVSALPRTTLTVEPTWSPVFTGESVTLKCEIESYSDWRYQWYKAADQDQYWCRGERGNRPSSSQRSNTVTLTVKERPKAVVSIQPDKQVFQGETVTLRCDIQGGGVSNWQYSWFKDDSSTPVSEQQYNISSVTESHSGKYTCRGTERGTSRYSHTSEAVTLTVSEKPKPELTLSHKGAALIGNPVVLYCKLDQSAGWKFYWFKHSQNPENETKTETHSYAISSVSVSDGGQYWCRAGRGNPVYYTHYSDDLWISVTAGRASFSVFSLLSSLMAVSPYLLVTIVLAVKFYRARGIWTLDYILSFSHNDQYCSLLVKKETQERLRRDCHLMEKRSLLTPAEKTHTGQPICTPVTVRHMVMWGGSGAAPEADDVIWTEELLNTWNENSFTEKVDETTDSGPINAGLKTLLKELRDFDGDGLRPNQEHKHQQNENYVGPYPDKSFYGYDTMNDKDRKQFDEWYGTVYGGVFDFKKEL